MVVRMGAGEVGSSVGQLVKDVRAMMEPHTAIRLKVSQIPLRASNAIKHLLNAAYAGAQIQQAERLHIHGWPTRRDTSLALLALQV